jgi:hypothetical protein
MTPARRWPIRPFIPAAIAAVTIPPIVWIGTVIGSKRRDLLYAEAVHLYWLAIAIAAASLLALVYSFVHSLSDETPDRRWRIRPFIAAAIMVFAIPPIVMTASLIEYLILDPLDGKSIGLWQFVGGIAAGSVLSIVYGVAHSLVITMAIVSGTRILIHKHFDSVWASLLLGAVFGLIVLGTPPLELELWPYLMIAGGGASALNWWVVVRPLRISRFARGNPPRPASIS